jgi:hypothetical protein
LDTGRYRTADGGRVMSTGGWMVKMMSERRLRRRILQTKKGLQQRDGW